VKKVFSRITKVYIHSDENIYEIIQMD